MFLNIKIINIHIKNKMLVLKYITQHDFDDIASMTKKISIMKFIGNGKVWDKNKVKKFIEYNIEEQSQGTDERVNYYYKIVDNGNFIGIIGAHTMRGMKGMYLTVMIEKRYQGMGYYKKSMELFKSRLKRKKVSFDILKSLVRKSNRRMNQISRRHSKFNREVTIKGEKFNEYLVNL
jgi:RimJ/RimL family protein N-acetyltransferase